MTGSRRHLGVLLPRAGGMSMAPDSRFWPVVFVIMGVAGCGGGGGGPGAANEAVLNRAPQIAAIPDQVNSAATYATRVRPSIVDPDGDPISIIVGVDDADVGAAYWDASRDEVVLEPRGPGRATVSVSVSDAEAVTTTNFFFDVGPVSRQFELEALTDGSQAVEIMNVGEGPVEFQHTHNGFRTFDSVHEIVAHVRDSPAALPGEPFEMKLWRFLRDSVYHDVFIDPAPWRMSPTVLLNSFGFGLCSSVAYAYRALAAEAGYEARVWALSGHVVPEIKVDGRWQVFDPDLAVFYPLQDGRIAGIAELQADVTLITSPLQPFFGPEGFAAYAAVVGEIYGTPSDNFVWEGLDHLPAGLPGRVVLPAGARLIYPGRWTSEVIARGDDGAPTPVAHFRQAAIELPAGWSGTLDLPWVVWDVQGTGDVLVDGVSFVIGSTALESRLRDSPSAIPRIDIFATTEPVTVVLLVNPLRYDMAGVNAVEVVGQDVWQVEASIVTLPLQHRTPGRFPDSARKPVP
jgi:hypothetical protein